MVARISVEAKLRIVVQGMCGLLWLKKLLEKLRIKIEGPMKLYYDNKTTINIANNLVQHDKTKHVEIDKHFIKEKLKSGLICTPFMSTNEQLANIFTKGLPKQAFELLVNKLGLIDIFKLD